MKKNKKAKHFYKTKIIKIIIILAQTIKSFNLKKNKNNITHTKKEKKE